MDTTLKEIGMAVNHARKNKKMNQAELATLSGISQQQLSRIERGESYNILTLIQIINALNLHIELTSELSQSARDIREIITRSRSRLLTR